MALLHGHSYTAHAMGCTAAAKAIQWFRDPFTNPNVQFKEKKLREVCLVFFYCSGTLLICENIFLLDVLLISFCD